MTPEQQAVVDRIMGLADEAIEDAEEAMRERCARGSGQRVYNQQKVESHDALRTAIEELAQQAAASQPLVPAGWKIVPVEPTPQMVIAAWGEVDEAAIYRAMLAASPAVQEAPAAERAVATIECHGLDTPARVCFYEQDFYALSNFSSFRLTWAGIDFATSEAAYHWEKFPEHPNIRSGILYARSAHDAFKLAEAGKKFRRPDWDAVKVDIMRGILRAKAEQHEYVRRKLLATGDRELVENSWRDDFWGWGPTRDGQNMLGKLWMQVRAELREGSLPEGRACEAPSGEATRPEASATPAVQGLTEAEIDDALRDVRRNYSPTEDGFAYDYAISRAIEGAVRRLSTAPEQAAQSPELAAEPPELTTGAARPIFDQLAEMGRNFAEQAAQQADAALTDEWIDALLDELDDIARKHDRFGEYGLPLHCDSDDEAPHAAMRKAVRAAMAASKKEG